MLAEDNLKGLYDGSTVTSVHMKINYVGILALSWRIILLFQRKVFARIFIVLNLHTKCVIIENLRRCCIFERNCFQSIVSIVNEY